MTGSASPRRAPGCEWLLRQPAEESPALLFCLPYPGTGASMYHQWPRRIGVAEVCPVQLPGRENRLREPPYKTYEELAAALVDGLLPFLDRPFGFFGHCGSVFVGFEATLLLEPLGLPGPSHLFVSSVMPPCDAANASPSPKRSSEGSSSRSCAPGTSSRLPSSSSSRSAR